MYIPGHYIHQDDSACEFEDRRTLRVRTVRRGRGI